MKRELVSTDLSVQDILDQLFTNQKERKGLLEQLGSKISKETDGSFFLSDENALVPKYWLDVAREHPQIIPAAVNLDDFALKAEIFEVFCNLRKNAEKISIGLKSPRDIISQDCYWYVSYITKQINMFKSDPIFKKILQDAPVIREPNKKADSAALAAKATEQISN